MELGIKTAPVGRQTFASLASTLLFLLAAPTDAAVCRVTSVHDGDTLTAQCPAGRLKVRLAEIDAPERTQPYSRRSTDALKALCVGKSATIREEAVDRYGRTIARVHCGGVDVNAEQVKTGMAWAFDKYLTDPSIKALEAEARRGRRGLWQAEKPQPPWEFRHK